MINLRQKNDSDSPERRLLSAGAVLFSERGYDGTTTRDIARAAAANIALITYHFGGKEGLHAAVLAESVSSLCDAITRSLAIVSGREQRGDALLRTTIHFVAKEKGAFASLFARESIARTLSPTTARIAVALQPVFDLLNTILPTCDFRTISGSEYLTSLVRLCAPMPSLEKTLNAGERLECISLQASILLRSDSRSKTSNHDARIAQDYGYMPQPLPILDFVD